MDCFGDFPLFLNYRTATNNLSIEMRVHVISLNWNINLRARIIEEIGSTHTALIGGLGDLQNCPGR